MLKDAFDKASKLPSESYTTVATRLRNLCTYYFESRQANRNYDRVIDILCADRLKQTLTRECLNYVIDKDVEADNCHRRIAEHADNFSILHKNYNHLSISKDRFRPSYDTRNEAPLGNNRSQVSVNLQRPIGGPVDNSSSRNYRVSCYRCGRPGHFSSKCPEVQKPSGPVASSSGKPYFHDSRGSDPRLPQSQNVVNHPLNVNVCRVEDPLLNNHKCVDENDLHFVDIIVGDSIKVRALIDSGANSNCIRENLLGSIDHLPFIVHQFLGPDTRIPPELVKVIPLAIRPQVHESETTISTAPVLTEMFVVKPYLRHEALITSKTADLLKDLKSHQVVASNEILEEDKGTIEQVSPEEQPQSDGDDDIEVISNDDDSQVVVGDNAEISQSSVNSYTCQASFLDEQLSCESLKSYWAFGAVNKINFIVKNKLLYHKKKLGGRDMQQLCLPESRIPIVLRTAHVLACADLSATKSTCQRIKLNFRFPNMESRVKSYVDSSDICQKRATFITKEQTLIQPKPLGNEHPFSHVRIDCNGPLIPVSDSTVTKPPYNHALVIFDKFSRWLVAYPLKSMTPKNVCETLLQSFMTFSIPNIISSDRDTYFTYQLRDEFRKHLGYSPYVHTPGHSEASGLVERCNKSIEQMLMKFASDHPKRWHKLLPLDLWTLREKPSSVTHVSPYTLDFGGIPRGSLCILKEAWSEIVEPLLSVGRTTNVYLKELRTGLELAGEYSTQHPHVEPQRYARNDNSCTSSRGSSVGELLNRWHGPGTMPIN